MKLLVNNFDDLRAVTETEVKTEASDLPFASLAGVPVEIDQRLPRKVWALVPRGGGLMDPDVRIGHFDEDGREAARGLKSILELTRGRPALY